MIISKLILKNWKNFQHAEVDFAFRAFIVGANASGKSNLLDAIRFLRDIVKQTGGLQFAVSDVRGGVSKIRCLAARKDTEVSLEVHLADAPEQEAKWKYRISFKHTGGGIFKNQAAVTEEYVWSSADKEVLNRKASDSGEDKETLLHTHLQQPTVNHKFREIYHFFQDSNYLHIVPQLIREADSYLITANKEDFYGRNLLERMAVTNENTRNAYLRRINAVLRIAVPQLEALTFVRDGKGVPHLEARYVHWRAKDAKQQEIQFSDGTLRLIGFMWALLDGTETILMEEPELYLHTAIVEKLPEFISQMQKRKGRARHRQVLVTTHSYDMLKGDSIAANEVVVLEPQAEGTRAITANNLEDVRKYLEAGFSMADAVIPKVAPKKIERMLQTDLWD